MEPDQWVSKSSWKNKEILILGMLWMPHDLKFKIVVASDVSKHEIRAIILHKLKNSDMKAVTHA